MRKQKQIRNNFLKNILQFVVVAFVCVSGFVFLKTYFIQRVQLLATGAGGNVAAGNSEILLSQNASVTASKFVPTDNHPPLNAVDGDPNSSWSASDFAPQWIEIKLANPQVVSNIYLNVSMYPAGTVVVNVKGGSTTNPTTLLKQFNQTMKQGDVLVVPVSPPQVMQYIRVETVSSPSWVSWNEIEAYGPAYTDITSGATVSVSSDYGSTSQFLIDKNSTTAWNSGGFAPQWFELNLNKLATVDKIRLNPNQSPNGNTTIRVYAGSTPNPQTLVKETTLNIVSGTPFDILFTSPLTNIQYIRVTTVSNPSSWVSWFEAQVFTIAAIPTPTSTPTSTPTPTLAPTPTSTPLPTPIPRTYTDITSGATVSVSSDYGSTSQFLIDKNSTTAWNSGGFAPQWFELNLNKLATVDKIRLNPNQSPNGNTTIRVYAGSTPNPQTLVKETTVNIVSGTPFDILFTFPLTNIQYIRVTTVSNPSSWVSWFEAQVFTIAAIPTPTPTPSPAPYDITSGASVYVSNDSANTYKNLTDKNNTTAWNSGGFAPQWFELNLNKLATVDKIRLNPNQSPNGNTTIRVYAGNTPNPQTLVKETTLNIVSGTPFDILFTSPLTNIQYIRVTTVSNPSSWVSWFEAQVFASAVSPITTVVTPTKLENFGYYFVQSQPQGAADFVPSIANNLNNSNLGVIGHDLALNRAKTIGYLNSFRNTGMKALFSMPVDLMFFPPGGSIRTLDPNWISTWNTYKQSIGGFEDAIAGFYLEEPFWNHLDEDGFRTLTAKVRQDFPDKKVMAVEAYPPLQNNQVTPRYIEFLTDYGFDYYYTSSHWAPGGTWDTYISIFNKMKTLAAGKKLWIVPEVFSDTLSGVSALAPALQQYYQLAKATPEVTGMLPFLYATLPGAGFSYTAQSFFDPTNSLYNPNLRSVHIQIGKAITGK